MEWYYILLIFILVIILLIFSLSYLCFKITFYSNRKKKKEDFELPPGKLYLQYKDQIIRAIKEARKIPHKDFYIESYDGLKLHARYYECQKGAPMEILFHGYRGDAERDLSNGIERCFKLNRNALIVDQRGSGESEGNVITFGIKERKDCLTWINFAIKEFGNNVEIIITGISMGAATVMMASSMDLPKNVIGTLADCGYSSPKDIIKKVIKQIHLPTFIFYPLIKLGAKLFGKFNLEEYSPYESVQKSKVPIIFIHGNVDNFVPCYMSEKLYKVCNTRKELVIIPEAGHGLAYLVEPEMYLTALENFFKQEVTNR